MRKRIERALVSVYNKEGLAPLVKALSASGVELVSTGGTQRFIEELGLPVVSVESLSGVPSILGGRVKTLHPALFAGILAQRSRADDVQTLQEHGFVTFDLVIVDLYPFAQTLQQGASEEELIEKIDIGGVSLIRAAAKNYHDVLVVASSSEYTALQEIVTQRNGETTLAERRAFAARAFLHTTKYDACIAHHFLSTSLSEEELSAEEVGAENGQHAVEWLGGISAPHVALRYGENPHQKAFFMGNLLAYAEQLHGEAPSYNNLLDLDAGVALVEEFASEATVTIVKHGTPCGLASAATPLQAWERALAGDRDAAFGGVIVLNCEVDVALAQAIDSIFFQICLAPSFTEEALAVFAKRKNRVILRKVASSTERAERWCFRSALNGFLVQTHDNRTHPPHVGELVTSHVATEAQLADLRFANIAVKHCRSNAITLVKNAQLIGVGSGHTSRIDALRHAITKAREQGHTPEGSVMASDAFFPFSDCVQEAVDHGIAAIVQPGGSIRDKDSIALAEQCGVPMYFTGLRHFKH